MPGILMGTLQGAANREKTGGKYWPG